MPGLVRAGTHLRMHWVGTELFQHTFFYITSLHLLHLTVASSALPHHTLCLLLSPHFPFRLVVGSVESWKLLTASQF